MNTENQASPRTSVMAIVAAVLVPVGIAGAAAVIHLRLYEGQAMAILMAVLVLAIVLGYWSNSAIAKSDGLLKGKQLATLGGQGGIIAAVLVVLAFINVPGFQKFQDRARQSEAKTNLGQIYNKQAEFFQAHNRYANSFEEIKWSPSNKDRYAYFLGTAEIQPAKGGPFKLPPNIKSEVTGAGFTAVAVGNVDRDDTFDVWTINRDKFMANPVDDVHN